MEETFWIYHFSPEHDMCKFFVLANLKFILKRGLAKLMGLTSISQKGLQSTKELLPLLLLTSLIICKTKQSGLSSAFEILEFSLCDCKLY